MGTRSLKNNEIPNFTNLPYLTYGEVTRLIFSEILNFIYRSTNICVKTVKYINILDVKYKHLLLTEIRYQTESETLNYRKSIRFCRRQNGERQTSIVVFVFYVNADQGQEVKCHLVT